MAQTILEQSPPRTGPTPEELKLARRATRRYGLFAPHLLRAALKQSFVMLRPDIQWKNPVMFVVEIGTVLSLIFTIGRSTVPRRGQPGDFQPSQEAECKALLVGFRRATGRLDRGVHLDQYQARVVEKRAARNGQLHTTRTPAEQIAADLIFQIADLATQGRL